MAHTPTVMLSTFSQSQAIPTTGVKEGKSLATTTGMAEGLLRTIHSEQAASHLVLLDVDTKDSAQTVGQVVLSKLQMADTKDLGHDTEFWCYRGTLHISCIYSDQTLNQKTQEI